MKESVCLKNLLLSEVIGDVSGKPYEFVARTKDYGKVDLLRCDNDYTDDTVCTFACAEALLHHGDMAETLHKRCRADIRRGFGGRFHPARRAVLPFVRQRKCHAVCGSRIHGA